MRIEIIQDKHLVMLEEFCNTCNELGYKNNSSFRQMRLLWCKSNGEYWCAVKQGKIVAVAGCHSMPEVSTSAYRILFRGCELPRSDNFKGLGKAQWNSITFRDFIPKFIEYLPNRPLYITTNIDKDHSNGRASRNHRTMGLMAKQGILENCGDILLNNTNQTLWQLNVNEYLTRRKRIGIKYVVGTLTP
jgi:hypothetical protein|tara:strand:+ start:123 stop:689 length:567 start_codon:yes stop_codon:yes gene_type:complete